MQIDREQFLKAVKFLKPAMLISDYPDAKNYLHVKIEGDNCQLTTSDGHCGKRVTLTRCMQLAIDEDEPLDPDQGYLIDKATLEGFETICQKHKTKFAKKSKSDQSLRLIDISSQILESHEDALSYYQSKLTFPEIDEYFEAKTSPVKSLKISPPIAIDVLKEFPGVVQMFFNGEEEAIYIRSHDITYQAFFMPIEPEGK